MTRPGPTTALLLATKARDVKPGQYGYLWTGQYISLSLHIYDGAQVFRILQTPFSMFIVRY